MLHAKPLERKELRVKAVTENLTSSGMELQRNDTEPATEQDETKISTEDELLLSPYVRFTKDNYEKEYEAERKLEDPNTGRAGYPYKEKQDKIVETVVKLRNGNVTVHEVFALIRGYCKHYNIDWRIEQDTVYNIMVRLVLEDKLTRIKVKGLWHYYPKIKA